MRARKCKGRDAKGTIRGGVVSTVLLLLRVWMRRSVEKGGRRGKDRGEDHEA